MTPVGHGCVGYLLATRSPHICVGAVVTGALLPDIDFVLVWSAAFNELHRTATHSFVFVMLAGAIASWMAPAGRRRTVGLSLVLGGLSHLLIDSFLDSNPSNGLGVAFLWPFVQEPISWVNILDAGGESVGWSEPLRKLPELWPMLGLELPLVLCALWVWLRRRSAKQ